MEMTKQRVWKINVFILSLPRTLQALVSVLQSAGLKLYASIFDDLQWRFRRIRTLASISLIALWQVFQIRALQSRVSLGTLIEV